MEAELQRVEVEAVRRDDDDLAVDHALGWQSGEERIVQRGEIPIERTQIAALDVEIRGAAEHDCAKAIPFGLVEKAAIRGKLVGKFCEHRLDWRPEGIVAGGWFNRRRFFGRRSASRHTSV